MHLVIVSTPRAGAHMLRSMLRADPLVDDIGAFIFPDDVRVIDPPTSASSKAVREVYELELAARPGRLLLSHIKLMHGHFDAITGAAETGGRFVFLRRRDHLSQACSLLLAMKYSAFNKGAPSGATITPTVESVMGLIEQFKRLEKLAALYLKDLPQVSLAYEDINLASVSATVADLTGMRLAIDEPTTVKSAPRLADYVANLSDLI